MAEDVTDPSDLPRDPMGDLRPDVAARPRFRLDVRHRHPAWQWWDDVVLAIEFHATPAEADARTTVATRR